MSSGTTWLKAMLEIGRLAQELARLFEPPGRWMFVKIIVVLFCATAVARILPWKPRTATSNRSKRATVGLWSVSAVTMAACLTGATLVATKADHQYTIVHRRQVLAAETVRASLAPRPDNYFGVYEADSPGSFDQV